MVLWPAYSPSSLCSPHESSPMLTGVYFYIVWLRSTIATVQSRGEPNELPDLTGKNKYSLFILAKYFDSKLFCTVFWLCHKASQNEQMMQEACTEVQFATTAFLIMCSSSISRKKTYNQWFLSRTLTVIGFFFSLHCFMQILNPFSWYLELLLKDDGILKLETWLLLNRENAKITSEGVRATKCSAQPWA